MKRGLLAILVLPLAGCGGCGKPKDEPPVAVVVDGGDAPAVVAEALPRCRPEGAHVAIAGEDVVVGDVAVGPAGLLVGVVRREGGKRLASVVRAPLDLSATKVIDLGVSFGDDPPPSPRWNGAHAFAAILGRTGSDAGIQTTRGLQVISLGESAVERVVATVVQQADESTAFDVAWPEGDGPALAAWDEDAPPAADAGAKRVSERGFVKVQLLGEGSKPRVASPETTDAESPRIVPRAGGFWLAWIAQRLDATEGSSVEGPGEKRFFRWVEAVALDAKGETASPVRKITPDKGRVVSFELARDDRSRLVVIAQDEAAPTEGAGDRVSRITLDGDHPLSIDVVDGGVGHALADLVPEANVDAPNATRWLAWTDTSDRAHLTPLSAAFALKDKPTAEPSLDGARVLAAAPGGSGVFALTGQGGQTGQAGQPDARPELRRFACK